MGQARRFADIMNLAAMKPDEKVAATRYCLAQPGREYLVFQHNKGEFTVNLADARGVFEAAWYDINAGKRLPPYRVEGGAVRTFTTPFPGPAALHLKLVE
jgi:hypothetical protein